MPETTDRDAHTVTPKSLLTRTPIWARPSTPYLPPSESMTQNNQSEFAALTEQVPFFAKCESTMNRRMIAFVAGNVLVIVTAGAYLVTNFANIQLHPFSWLVALVSGYFLADFVSGIIHWAIDTWFSEQSLGRMVAIAREHHTHPRHVLEYRFVDHATLGSVPSVLFFGPMMALVWLLPSTTAVYVGVIWSFIITLTLLFGTSLHNLGHRQPQSRLLRILMMYRLVLSPKHHMVHHLGDQTVRYCVVNGWANPLCDHLGVWRGLEAVIMHMTDSIPRENDRKWQEHYQKTGEIKSMMSS